MDSPVVIIDSAQVPAGAPPRTSVDTELDRSDPIAN